MTHPGQALNPVRVSGSSRLLPGHHHLNQQGSVQSPGAMQTLLDLRSFWKFGLALWLLGLGL